MSAQQTFLYCHDCRALDYGVPDKNGVFQRDSAATNHWDHDIHVFGAPQAYEPPVRLVLMKLQAGQEVTNNEMVIFKLCIDLQGLPVGRAAA